MHRHWPERALAALLLLWFTAFTAEPGVVHSCPEHGWAAPTAATSAASHAGAHGAGPAGHPAGHSLPEPDRGHGGCTCIGDCSAGGMAGGVPAGRLALAAAPASHARSEHPRAESPAITAPAFLLPYANGPPAGRRVA